MNLLKAILKHEVFPALGCTEPTACAYCAAVAARELGEPFTRLRLTVDAATFKNGACVLVPNTGGRTGNPIAAVLGALIADPDRRLQILDAATPELIARAAAFTGPDRLEYGCTRDHPAPYIDVELTGVAHSARCRIAETHTRILEVMRDNRITRQAPAATAGPAVPYRAELRTMRLNDLIVAATRLDDEDRDWLRRGIEMNLAVAAHGEEVRGTAFQLRILKDRGIVKDDLFHRAKYTTAAAVDVRMGGLPYPVMTSGGSGNQGIIAILLPYQVARELGIDDETMLQSIAVSHVVNAFVKCFVGELAAVCGCAVAAGIGAAVAIVFQQAGPDEQRINMAVNNVIGDLGGLICDGAKPGCALKMMTSVDSALRSGFLALAGYGLSAEQGLLGATAEDSIRHLARVSREGMTAVDPTVIDIMSGKQRCPAPD